MTGLTPQPARRTAFLFDLDGTLVDSAPGILHALGEAFAAIGHSLPATLDLRRLIGPPISAIAAALDPTLTPAQAAEVERAYRVAYDSEGWRRTALFPAADDVLRQLADAGHCLLLVTNKPRRPTLAILQELSIAGYFTEIITPDSRPERYRSKAEMVAELVRRCQLEPEQSVFVGDTEEDAQAASRNGMHFLHAGFGYGQTPADAVSFNRFDGLLERAEELVRTGLVPAGLR